MRLLLRCRCAEEIVVLKGIAAHRERAKGERERERLASPSEVADPMVSVGVFGRWLAKRMRWGADGRGKVAGRVSVSLSTRVSGCRVAAVGWLAAKGKKRVDQSDLLVLATKQVVQLPQHAHLEGQCNRNCFIA